MLDVPEDCERAGYAVLMVCRAQAGSRVDGGAEGRAHVLRIKDYRALDRGELPCLRLPAVSGGPKRAATAQMGRAVLGRTGVQGVLVQAGLHGDAWDVQPAGEVLRGG